MPARSRTPGDVVVQSAGEEWRAGLHATADPASVGPAATVILLTQAQDSAAALASLDHIRGDVALALSLQNGGGTERPLQAWCGAERVAGGTSMVGATLLAPGRVAHTNPGLTFLGELEARRAPARSRWASSGGRRPGVPGHRPRALGGVVQARARGGHDDDHRAPAPAAARRDDRRRDRPGVRRARARRRRRRGMPRAWRWTTGRGCSRSRRCAPPAWRRPPSSSSARGREFAAAARPRSRPRCCARSRPAAGWSSGPFTGSCAPRPTASASPSRGSSSPWTCSARIDRSRSMSLEDRLARLEAEAAILRTLHRYGHAIDAGDEAAWVDLFTPDGEFQVRGPGVEYTISGRDGARRLHRPPQPPPGGVPRARGGPAGDRRGRRRGRRACRGSS